MLNGRIPIQDPRKVGRWEAIQNLNDILETFQLTHEIYIPAGLDSFGLLFFGEIAGEIQFAFFLEMEGDCSETQFASSV